MATKRGFPIGSKVLLDGQYTAIVKGYWPEGSTSYGFPHYKLWVEGTPFREPFTVVRADRVGVKRAKENPANVSRRDASDFLRVVGEQIRDSIDALREDARYSMSQADAITDAWSNQNYEWLAENGIISVRQLEMIHEAADVLER